MTTEVLAVVGAFISIALVINAYFIRTLIETLNDLRIFVSKQATQMEVTEKFTDKRLNILEDSHRELFNKINKITGVK